MKHTIWVVCIMVLCTALNVSADEKLTKSWVNMTVMSLSSMKQDKDPKRIIDAFSPKAKITVFIEGTINEETLDFNDDEETLTLSPEGFVGFLKKRAKGSRLYMLSRKKIWSTISGDGTKATTHSFLLEGSLGSNCSKVYIAEDATVELINGHARITELYWEIGE